jgi:hypothetical protein
LQQFGEANRNNVETFNMLTATNTQMATNIPAAVQTLQQQMQQLAMAVNAKAQPTPPGFPQGNQFSPQQHVPVPYNQLPHQPMHQHQPNSQPGRGNVRGRGRGCHGRRAGGRMPYQQQPMWGNQGQMYQPQLQQNQMYGQYVPNYCANTNKYFKNWNYCWT